jgi:hypothetical protein
MLMFINNVEGRKLSVNSFKNCKFYCGCVGHAGKIFQALIQVIMQLNYVGIASKIRGVD